jgi:hypothetical protein
MNEWKGGRKKAESRKQKAERKKKAGRNVTHCGISITIHFSFTWLRGVEPALAFWAEDTSGANDELSESRCADSKGEA